MASKLHTTPPVTQYAILNTNIARHKAHLTGNKLQTQHGLNIA